MCTDIAKLTYRKEYKPLPIKVQKISLNIELGEESTLVKCATEIVLKDHTDIAFLEAHGRTPLQYVKEHGLLLHGHKMLQLNEFKLNGYVLKRGENYELINQNLHLSPNLLHQEKEPTIDVWKLSTEVCIQPQKNTELEGLYKSGGTFCTQCEAEGFRAITYAFDRPDVLSKFDALLIAEESRYPVLLCNGNLSESGKMQGRPGFHFTRWVDPFPKPSYLFAIVAGKLSRKTDSFETMSGRNVALHMYSDECYLNRLDHAMASLKKAMKWDEVTFGREYDLDLFNVVAVDDFNMGAMENKSLNIFNTKVIVADSKTATDFDYEYIEGVVGHEYFHNWTGNRVTCRDWFQLTLKEGLTVYRDGEFSCDMNSRAVTRLGNISVVRSRQFAQDQSPMSHPVRPDVYETIDNFYTTTVYEKGAEVVRMYETLLGRQGFRKGMDLYFQRHDGQAVTCEDFLSAMADANEEDLSQFRSWYSTAGTPMVEMEPSYDSTNEILILKVTQNISSGLKDTAEKSTPLLIPIRIAFLHPKTGDLLSFILKTDGQTSSCEQTIEAVLRVDNKENYFTFHLSNSGASTPVISSLRGFSAPVQCRIKNQKDTDLMTLLRHDTDEFVRYDAGQSLCREIILGLYRKARQHFLQFHGLASEFGVNSAKQLSNEVLREILFSEDGRLSYLFEDCVVKGFQSILTDEKIDNKFKAHAISLPVLNELISEFPHATLDPPLFHHVTKFLNSELSLRLRGHLEQIIDNIETGPVVYSTKPAEVARRAIVNKAYEMLARLEDTQFEKRLLQRFRSATNMTDEIAALQSLNYNCSSRSVAFDEFHEKWKNEPLVILKWYRAHATANVPNNIGQLESIYNSSSFVKTNPNSIYSLIAAFEGSHVNFHDASYSGYAFMARHVLSLDKFNAQVAARVVNAFALLRYYTPGRQAAIRGLLQMIGQTEGLSKNVAEIVRKTLSS